MKKVTHVVALSTIVFGAISPTIRAGADISLSAPISAESDVLVSKNEEIINSEANSEISNISNEPEKSQISAVSKENNVILPQQGEIGFPLTQKGYENASALPNHDVSEMWSKKDWSIVRASEYNGQVQVSPQSTRAAGDWTNASYMFYGNVYFGTRDSQGRFIDSFEVFSLDASEMPTLSEVSNFSQNDISSHEMGGNPSQDLNFKGYSVDYTQNIQGQLGMVAPDSIFVDSSKADLPRTDVTAIVIGSVKSSTAQIPFEGGHTIKFTSGTPDGQRIKGDYTDGYSDPYGRTHQFSQDSLTGLTGIYGPITQLKKSDAEIFAKGVSDERISNPLSLISDVIESNEGIDYDANKQANVEWEVAPDLTTPTQDGSAVLKVTLTNPSNGEISLPSYLRVPYIVKDIQPITVQYVDEQGQSIHANQTIAPTSEGDPYDASTPQYKLDIPGYHLDDSKLPNNATGVFGEQPVVVTYVYKENQTAINVHDSTIYVGDSWTAEDNFDSAVDRDGKAVDFTQLTVDDSKVDTSKVGIYDVTYTYDGITAMAKVTVKDNLSAINVHDSTIHVGDSWTAEDNFDSAVDKDGKAVDFTQLTVDDSKVDTSKAGIYDVTYTYDGITVMAKVTVKENLSAINVHDSTIHVGDSWTAEDNFDSAFDKEGNPINFTQLSLDTSRADTSKAGKFEVTYTYDGVTSTAIVTVKDKEKGEPTQPSEPEKPGTSDNDTSGNKDTPFPNPKTDNSNVSDNSKSLPETGENERMTMMSIILGMTLLGVGLVVSVFRFNKAKK